MKIVGICGGSGSGKGTVSTHLLSLGYPVIDTDKIYHDLISHETECLRDIRAEFGDSVVSSGRLDRRALAKVVFSGDNSSLALKRLNSITHHYVLDEVRSQISHFCKLGADLVFVDVPLLFESGFDKECDVTVSVLSDREIRIMRICRRDGIDRAEAERRIDSQLPDSILSEKTDYSLCNNGAPDDLRDQINELIKNIR